MWNTPSASVGHTQRERGTHPAGAEDTPGASVGHARRYRRVPAFWIECVPEATAIDVEYFTPVVGLVRSLR
ncbi:hypothetical protein EV186_103113 [Labedaea rhizosphaerae]|uniref:Uncharacterized protein n=1 Tax=Labedaea rhizosphaerae TaxID=598644 RepID=A0A4R6SB57_LABRH|nr:hypothetical protein EV186_103113 [Labedaea rhizosphaerae]